MLVKQIEVMHLTTVERMWAIVLRVTGMAVLGEAALSEVGGGVMPLDEAVKVLDDFVLKPHEAVTVMMDVVVEGGPVVPDVSVMAVLFEVVLEELNEVVLEELDEIVMQVLDEAVLKELNAAVM